MVFIEYCLVLVEAEKMASLTLEMVNLITIMGDLNLILLRIIQMIMI